MICPRGFFTTVDCWGHSDASFYRETHWLLSWTEPLFLLVISVLASKPPLACQLSRVERRNCVVWLFGCRFHLRALCFFAREFRRLTEPIRSKIIDKDLTYVWSGIFFWNSSHSLVLWEWLFACSCWWWGVWWVRSLSWSWISPYFKYPLCNLHS
jgi:hypothetical protein